MNFCKQHGIIQQFTVPHTPQQNGVAERKNRTLVECARSMLQGKGISNGLWAEAINTAVYLKNRSPTKCLGFKTPFEALFGLKPTVDHLRIFGSKAFAHILKLDRKKLDPKALKCIFVGYGTEYKAYKLYNPVTHKVFASRDVIFHEQTEDGKEDSDDESHIPFMIELNSEDEEEQVQEQEQKQEEVAADGIISDDAGLDSTETERVEVSSLPRRSGRKTRLLAKLRDYALMSKILNIVEPLNYEEASRSDEWRAAMHEEMESIYRNHTWDLVELPKGKTPIGCKWVYKPKINADGTVEKFKARLVAKGYSQQEGIDFDDTFAPVAKINTIRMLICLATKHKWKLHQLDVKSAFLNGELKEEIYLVQPPGFVKKGQEHFVCKLHKALYGLKQAPRSCYDKIDSFFVQHSFHKSLNDPNLYTKINKQRQIILISLYVDDMIIIGNANSLIKEIKQKMSQEFEMKDLGDLHYCLGLEVWKDSGQTFLTQGKYARNLLERFRMEQCKTAATPLQQNLKLSSDDGTKQVDATLYRQLVGSLIYLTTTRSYLAYSVSVLSQLMSRPLDSHWNAAKCVLRYLSDTCNYGILYTDSSNITLAGYSDSDWAGNLDDRRSITEYQAFCAATCEAIWLRRLLSDAGEGQKSATSIKIDNQSTIKLAYNPVFHKNTKHIDTQFHFVREKIQSKEICVDYCNTCDNLADIFTKPLGRIKFELLRRMLGVHNNPFFINGGR
eukprot:PITA_05243